MGADASFRDWVLESLGALDAISSRAMFGGFGLFSHANMFALISGSALFFKVDESNRERYVQAGSTQFKPMPYFRVPDNVIEDREQLMEWAQGSIAIARASTAKKR